jgi:hypothetical protein
MTMQPENDDPFDQLLSQHLSGQLDGQQGRALRHFHQSLAATRRRRLGWLAGITAAAAAVAIAWPHLRIADNRPGPEPLALGPASQPRPMAAAWERSEQTFDLAILDEGPVLVDGQWLRQLRQLELSQVRLIDSRGQTVLETVIPRQQLVYVDAVAY